MIIERLNMRFKFACIDINYKNKLFAIPNDFCHMSYYIRYNVSFVVNAMSRFNDETTLYFENETIWTDTVSLKIK